MHTPWNCEKTLLEQVFLMMDTVPYAKMYSVAFEDLANCNFSERCVSCGSVYSASMDLLRLLWAPESPSLLGRQSHPADEQGHSARRSGVSCVEIPHCSCFRIKKRL